MRIVLMVITLLPFAAFAADQKGNYAVWGAGARSCHTYNQARAQGDMESYRSYIMGYLTAYDALVEDTYSISGTKTIDEIVLWLDNYCEMKPVHAFDQALADFTTDHIPTRSRRKPGQYAR